MSALLDEINEAHGGLERWRNAATIEADIAIGGPFWELKGIADFAGTAHVVADVQRQHNKLTYPSGRVPGWPCRPGHRLKITNDRGWPLHLRCQRRKVWLLIIRSAHSGPIPGKSRCLLIVLAECRQLGGRPVNELSRRADCADGGLP
jgi:hypothetical protein